MAGKVPPVLAQKVQKQGYVLGVVVAKHHPKTIKVAVDRHLRNRKYNNNYTRRSLFQVHDELNEADPGDLIIMKQSRRHSKTKYFELYDIAVKYPAVDFLQKNPEYAEAMVEINKNRRHDPKTLVTLE